MSTMKICASCGIPLDKSVQSNRSQIYCIYCQDQKSGKLATHDEVRKASINATMKFMGKTREEAEKMTDQILPSLPRWRKN